MSFRSRLRPVKRAAALPIELLWRASFTVAGWSHPSRARTWASTGGKNVLVVAPHPDDEAIGCGGTMLRHALSGDRVVIAIATDGRRAQAIPDPARMAAHRKNEAVEAARLLRNARLEWIGLPEGEWAVAQLRDVLAILLDEIRPDIVYAPSRVDFHPEHRTVAHALALALEAAGTVPRATIVRVYQVQVPLTAELVNVVNDVSSVLEAADTALRAYASQSGSIECTYRRRRYSARRHRLPGAVEEFWELQAAKYIELHRDPPARWHDEYRGMRHFPMTDPLAWLVGSADRKQLRSRVERRSA